MKSSKLIVRLKGGLGNQLFCYAAARRLALMSDAELILDDITGFKYDYEYKRKFALSEFSIPARKASYFERLEPLGRVRRFIEKKIAETKPLEKRRYIVQSGVDFQGELLTLRLQTGYTYFDGFGQSELYFQDVEKIIKQDLKLNISIDGNGSEYLYQLTNTEAVAIHLRWFDSNISALSNVPMSYYYNAIQLIKQELIKPHFYIFSENIQLASELISTYLQPEEFTLVKTNTTDAIVDFFLMTKCKHFIIGNSTYAWWAAWLGEDKQTSIIVSPKLNIDPNLHVNAWGFEHLIPNRWKIIQC